MKKLSIAFALIVSLCAISHLHSADAGSLDERLYQAVDSSQEDDVRTLLSQGANFNTFLPTIAMLALATGNITILGMLLDAGMDPNIILHLAAETNNKEAVEILLGFGADATLTNAAGQTPEELTTDPGIKALLSPSFASKGLTKSAHKR